MVLGGVELVHVAVNIEDYSTMGYGRQEGAIHPGSDSGLGSQEMTSSGHIPMIWSLTTPNFIIRRLNSIYMPRQLARRR